MDPSRKPMRRDPRIAGRTCAHHTRKLSRVSFSETWMWNIVEAAIELEDDMIVVDGKKNEYSQLDALLMEEVALIPCSIVWNGLPIGAPVLFII